MSFAKRITIFFIAAALIAGLAALGLYAFFRGGADTAGTDPINALSARSAQSVYITARLGDLNGLMRDVFSPALAEAVASSMGSGALGMRMAAVRMAADIASQIPARSTAIVMGMGENGPFFQAAASLPPESRDRLARVQAGDASGEDLISLLGGEASLPLFGIAASGVRKLRAGEMNYYILLGVSFTAKNGLLLAASDPDELLAAAAATENPKNRLTVKRRFDGPDYVFLHVDEAALRNMPNGDMAPLLTEPLNTEIAFESKPGTLLMSLYTNAQKALGIPEIRAGSTSETSLFLAGGGKALAALSLPLAFNASYLKNYPVLSRNWKNIMNMLELMGISEKDVEDLLTGRVNVVWGSPATIDGQRIPGGYAALRGRNGAAAKFANVLAGTIPGGEAGLGDQSGWDLLLTPELWKSMPPIVIGVTENNNTLVLGILDRDGLAQKPALPSSAADLAKKGASGWGFLDGAAARDWLKDLTEGTELASLWNRELPVSFVKLWSPDNETAFAEFSLSPDAPAAGFALLAGMMAATGSATESAEATKIINDLRNLKSASLLYYGDNLKWPTQSDAPKLDQYSDRPLVSGGRYERVIIGGEYEIDGVKRANIGVKLPPSMGTLGVRRKLESKARDASLLNGAQGMAPYKKESMEVFMNMR
jgi:general secretion pathway protein G